MEESTRKGVSRRGLLKVTGAAAAAAAAMFGQFVPKADAHDLKPDDPLYHYAEYEAIVNRRDASVRMLFQWPNINNTLLYLNARSALNAFQFSYGLVAKSLQIVVQAYASANAALYDDYIWKKYSWGEILNIQDPDTGKPAERNIWYDSSVDWTLQTPPYSRDHAYYGDASIQGLQRRGVLFLI